MNYSGPISACLSSKHKNAGKDVNVVLVPEQAGWHVAKELQAPINITLLHLPRDSPELNSVERLWVHV